MCDCLRNVMLVLAGIPMMLLTLSFVLCETGRRVPGVSWSLPLLFLRVGSTGVCSLRLPTEGSAPMGSGNKYPAVFANRQKSLT